MKLVKNMQSMQSHYQAISYQIVIFCSLYRAVCVRHFITYYPLEGHPRGQFITFSPQEGHPNMGNQTGSFHTLINYECITLILNPTKILITKSIAWKSVISWTTNIHRLKYNHFLHFLPSSFSGRRQSSEAMYFSKKPDSEPEPYVNQEPTNIE